MTAKKRPTAKRAKPKAKTKRKAKTKTARRGKAGRAARLTGDRALGIVLGLLVGVLIGLVAGTWFEGGTGDAPELAVPAPEAPPREKPPAVAVIPETLAPKTPEAAEPEPVPDLAAAEPETADVPDGAWRAHAVDVALIADRPKIAIVIDDLGLDRPRSARAIALPGPMTMAYLPYAHDLAAQTAAARAVGHELLVHLPAQPMDAEADPGPDALMTGLPPEELRRRVDTALAAFDGYVGLNNHMGSRFTADAAGMNVMMDALRDRGLVYLDSLTTGGSLGARVAAQTGVPFAVRDIFLDHLDDPIAIRDRLAETEAVARHQGFAIAIGHPRDNTLDALEEWLAEIETRGFQLVPVSALIGRGRGEG